MVRKVMKIQVPLYINFTAEKRNKDSADKINKYEKKRQKEMKKLGKAYLKDYTEFNYKIDSILNEGYTFIKKVQPIKVTPVNVNFLYNQ